MLKFLNISDFLIGISSCSETPSKCAIVELNLLYKKPTLNHSTSKINK